MTVGEKIQFYRKMRKMTQRSLSELSSVSEISIRKYEAGERNPKSEQLKKIASVLEIGENLLMDIELQNLQLETVGDFMSIFYVLRDRLGMDFAVDFNADGSINTDNLAVHFNNDKINKCLERLATEQMMVSQKRNELLNATPPIDPEQVERELMIDSFLLDTTKEELCQSTEPLFEDAGDFK